MHSIKQKKHSSNSICLNLCSSCNLKCSWCYKQSVQEPSLEFTKFKSFFKHVIEHNVDSVTLIGGEPTVHPNFLSIIELLKNQQILLTTNGLMFSNLSFLRTCIDINKQLKKNETGLVSISVSLKGYDKYSFLHTTKVDNFDNLCLAINNLYNSNLPTTYSYTYSNSMQLEQMKLFVSFLKAHHIDSIILNDVRPYLQTTNTTKHPIIAKGFDTLVFYLEDMGITTYMRLNHPLCRYNSALIDFAINNHRLISKCALKTHTGYFFSASLNLIPCNELASISLGKYGLDFNTFAELEQLWNTQDIHNFYQQLSGYPNSKCKHCNLWKICGGSCILHWLNKEETL